MIPAAALEIGRISCVLMILKPEIELLEPTTASLLGLTAAPLSEPPLNSAASTGLPVNKPG
jgi:hypothetical protein